jgi:probable HAF family extracellular repeat protein
MVGIGDLPGGGFSSGAQAISGDGRVIVGSGQTAAGFEAFRWTAAEGMVGLGDLPGGNFSSGANAVSADGNVIVGAGSGIGDSDGAFVWLPSLGMVSLKEYLKQSGVSGLDGWHLTYAQGISADGSTIVGTGVNPQGLFEGWVATIDITAPPIDVGETVTPSAILSITGAVSGGLARIIGSDDQYLVLGARANDVMQLVMESLFTGHDVGAILFEVESRANRSGTNQRIELFDFNAGTWSLVDSRGIFGTDWTGSVTILSNAARFVEPDTLRLRARITWQNATAKKRNQTGIFVDRVAWTRIP